MKKKTREVAEQLAEEALDAITADATETAQTVKKWGQIYQLPHDETLRDAVKELLAPVGCFVLIERTLRAHPYELILYPGRFVAATAGMHKENKGWDCTGIILAGPESFGGVPYEAFELWSLRNAKGKNHARYERLVSTGAAGVMTRDIREELIDLQQVHQANTFSQTQLRKMSRLNDKRIESRQRLVARAERWELKAVNGE